MIAAAFSFNLTNMKSLKNNISRSIIIAIKYRNIIIFK